MPKPRAAALLAALALLVAVAGWSRATLERTQAPEIQSALLYLPEGPYLRALALGQEETLADLVYIWAIQYYSNYAQSSRYEYVDAIFRGAIAELDPHFIEAYMVGAMIMTVEARRPDLALALFDVGLAKNPDNWELAYWAGWEAFQAKDYLRARDYWERAQRMEGAPPQLYRLAARTLEKAGDSEAAIAEYRRLLEQAPDEHTRTVVQQWLDRLLTQRALDLLRGAVATYRERFGRCPERLDLLARAGILTALPEVPEGMAFQIDAAHCNVLPAPGQSFGTNR